MEDKQKEYEKLTSELEIIKNELIHEKKEHELKLQSLKNVLKKYFAEKQY